MHDQHWHDCETPARPAPPMLSDARRTYHLAGLAIALINLALFGLVTALSVALIDGPMRLMAPVAIAVWCLHVQDTARGPLSARERWARGKRIRNMVIGTMSAGLMLWLLAYPIVLRII